MFSFCQIELLILVAGQPQDKFPVSFVDAPASFSSRNTSRSACTSILTVISSVFTHRLFSILRPPFSVLPDHNIPHSPAESYLLFQKKSTFPDAFFPTAKYLFISVPAVFSLSRILLFHQKRQTHLQQIPVPALRGFGSNGC